MPPRTPTPQEQIWAELDRSRALRVGTVNCLSKPLRDEVSLRAGPSALDSPGASGVEPTGDDDQLEEARAMIAEATRLVNDAFRREPNNDAIIGDSAALKDVWRQVSVSRPNFETAYTYTKREGSCHRNPH